MSIGMACNFYREPLALPGLLENAAAFFDDLLFISTPPEGKHDDESISIVQKFGARLTFDSIEQGFGHIRNRLIHETTTAWTMILDCDERFYPVIELLTCDGDEKYPEVRVPNLTVKPKGILHNQGALLKQMISDVKLQDAIITSRRTWTDFTFRRPAQNWNRIQDLQCRVVRNSATVGYQPDVKMHEKIIDFRTGKEPRMVKFDPSNPVYHDHFHAWFKQLHPEKNAEDIATYRALSEEGASGMWLNHAPGVKT